MLTLVTVLLPEVVIWLYSTSVTDSSSMVAAANNPVSAVLSINDCEEGDFA